MYVKIMICNPQGQDFSKITFIFIFT